MNNNIYYGYPFENYVTESLNSISNEFAVRDDEKFYHYASVDAVNSILQHKNQTYTMWASHLSFLNDSEEFVNGERLIFEALENFITRDLSKTKNEDDEIFCKTIKKFLDAAQNADKDISVDGEIIFSRNIYILCFCQEGNSLNQWKYYGKESGIALEFNLEECEFSGLDCNNKDKLIRSKLYRVIYDDGVKRKILEEVIRKEHQTFLGRSEDRERNLLYALAKMYELCPLFKHKDFCDEKECRLIFRPLYSNNDETQDVRTLVKYRKRGNILLPYMEIKMKTEEEYTAPLIKNIIIGPGENQELLYRSMRHFAIHTGVFDGYMKRGHDNIQEIVNTHIIRSDTPFRG